MTSWHQTAWLATLVLLALSATVHAKDQPKSDYVDDDPNLDFSHEEAVDYSEEHDKNRIDKSEEHESYSVEEFLVCREDKADLCTCDKNSREIDCRKETRGHKGKDEKTVEPLRSAALKVPEKTRDDFKIKYVYLNGNKIVVLDAESVMPALKDEVEGIDFGNNQIEFIEPGTFDGFKNLRKLRFHQNFISINESLDGWITPKLGATLELLDLGYNFLQKIHDGAFDPLHSLRRLILDGNPNLQLTDNTFKKGGLKNLDTLSLDKCGFKTLPDNLFLNLPKLRYVSLIGNPFTSVPAALNKVPTLLTIDLSKTSISEWKKDSLKEEHSVSTLYMQSMPNLQEIGDCAFCGLTNLTKIDLSGSKKLKTFDANAFGLIANPADSPKSTIKVFLAASCALTTLHEKMLPWSQLEKLGLAGNPWLCDKDLAWLSGNDTAYAFVGSDVPKCAKPDELKGKPLKNVVLEKTGAATGSSSSGIGGFFRWIFYMGGTIAIVSMMLLGLLYVKRRYGLNPFTRPTSNGVGFSNLNANVDLEDEGGLVPEDDDEFAPRPAAV